MSELSSHFGAAGSGVYLAAEDGDLDAVIQYILDDPILLYWANELGETPLFIACRTGNVNVVQYLHRAGSDIQRASDEGLTPLHIAVYKGHLSVVKYLAEIAKADIDFAEFNKGLTPLSIACATGRLDVAKYLIRRGASFEAREISGCTPLVIASGCGHLHIVQYLASIGADISSTNNEGYTALFAAAGAGHMEIVCFLLSLGAEVDQKNNKGYTAFYISCANGHLETARVLKDANANIDCTDSKGLTPLHAAVGSPKSSLIVFTYLVQNGADITLKDARNKQPLDYARREPLELLKTVISPIWHETLVHKLVYENDVDSLQQLLDLEGFDNVVDARGRDAWTPLHVAAYFNRTEAAKILLQAGADCAAVSASKEQTPLHIAAARNNVPTLRTMIRTPQNKASRGSSWLSNI